MGGEHLRITAVGVVITLSTVGCVAPETSFHNGNHIESIASGEIVVEYSPSIVEFEDLAIKNTRSIDIVMTNLGETDALIYSGEILVNQDFVFYIREESVTSATIVPNDSLSVTVTATLQEEGYFEGLLRLDTNNTANPLIDVALYAWSKGEEAPADTGFVE